MAKDNLMLLDAPENSSGITIEGVSYETDENNQILIPAHLSGHAIEHGFKTVPFVKEKQNNSPKKAADNGAKSDGEKTLEKTTETNKKPEPEKAAGDGEKK